MSIRLNANIESGLMKSKALGYHLDTQTRVAFMEILTQLLQQGTEFNTLLVKLCWPIVSNGSLT
ncbi:neurofibromin [Brachionus plicatilis]|uniref:Neurofibromin n=1 Tax=Brachionus plicatilis TaxID=10195 RepID=A0A3M7RH62_BRAPC|nr:neurofibromin [Brachionus plicatilis]